MSEKEPMFCPSCGKYGMLHISGSQLKCYLCSSIEPVGYAGSWPIPPERCWDTFDGQPRPPARIVQEELHPRPHLVVIEGGKK
jgi:hypothetical protein